MKAISEETIAHYNRALELLHCTPVSTVRRCELLLALGDAQNQAGVWKQAKETFERAAELARS